MRCNTLQEGFACLLQSEECKGGQAAELKGRCIFQLISFPWHEIFKADTEG